MAAEQSTEHEVYVEDGEVYESQPNVDESAMRRAVAGGAIGNALEWFDFGVYGYFAVIIGQEFFAGSGDKMTALLQSFAVFAVAFVARPFGSFVFGPLGDKIGRKRVMVITIMLMTVSTALVGVLPTYGMVGIWSTIGLIVLRLIQGFSTGGEYGSVATYICESAPDDRRGFWGSFLEVGTMVGYILAAVLALVLSAVLGHDAWHTWGWRVPFLCAIPLGLLGLWMRSNLEDSPAFNELKESGESEKTPLRTTFKSAWRTMLLCVGLVIMLNVAYYMVLKYMPSYLTTRLGMSEFEADLLSLGILIFILILLPFLGWLSDKIGRKPMWFAASAGFIGLDYLAFWLMHQGGSWLPFLGLAILAFFTAIVGSVVASTLPALFRTNVRNGGFSIAYNVSTAAFGGTAPFIITWLISVFDYDYIPAFYMMAAGTVALIAAFQIRETAGAPLLGSKSLLGSRSRRRKRGRISEQHELG